MIDFAADIVVQNDKFVAQVGSMERSVDNAMNKWRGDGAAAASERSVADKLRGNHLATAILGIVDDYNTYGSQLEGQRDALLKVADVEIPAAGMTVDDDGTVTAPRVPTGADEANPGASALAQQVLDSQASGLQTRVKALLTQFGDTETAAAQAIRSSLQELGQYQRDPDGAPARSEVQSILDGRSQLPADPRKLHEFWETLTPAEKDALYGHDSYLGNRDGLPTADRDHYNRLKLDDELTRAQNGDPGMQGKLGDLQAIQTTLDGHPDAMLMVMDTQSGDLAHAAISLGNPDTAENVSVTAPGLNTNVKDSLGAMVNEAAKVRDTATDRLDKLPTDDPRHGRDVATIAWIGADTPQGDYKDAAADLNGDTVRGYLQVADDRLAKAGAQDLASFYDGLRASHDGDPAHVTAVGHSYGSLMTSHALQDLRDSGRQSVDDLVVYGSPGLGLGYENPWWPASGDARVEDLGVSVGHRYEMTADSDKVAEFPRFGPNPQALPGFTHLETGASVTADGVHRDRAYGHSEYPRTGTGGELRTSGWNVAMIVAGLPDQAVGKH
ncbi:alpha/beta hydrolase [Nocardia jejuensis]|uniref:alpha/beta hydrolase n=1 Tax=Nocardia jejuensis TaxID=328049 RepID=UPI00082BCEDC|nr:alpha/beta hydrolase [Nocardia jejuensis]